MSLKMVKKKVSQFPPFLCFNNEPKGLKMDWHERQTIGYHSPIFKKESRKPCI